MILAARRIPPDRDLSIDVVRAICLPKPGGPGRAQQPAVLEDAAAPGIPRHWMPIC